MPFRLLNPKQPGGPEPPLEAIAPPKLGSLAAPSESLLADMRMSTIWYAILERDPDEARQKLFDTVKQVVGVDVVPDFVPPCVVRLDEARTKVEGERIRRAYRRLATVYAKLIDKLVRYNPESRPYAFDAFNQDLTDREQLIRPFLCENFRKPAEETEAKKSRRKKSSSE